MAKEQQVSIICLLARSLAQPSTTLVGSISGFLARTLSLACHVIEPYDGATRCHQARIKPIGLIES